MCRRTRLGKESSGWPVVLSGACAPRRRPRRPPSPHRGLRNARWSPVGVLESNQLGKLETRPGVFAAGILQEQTHGLQGCPGEPGVLGGPARAWGQPGLVKWAVSTHLGSSVQLRERWPGWEWTPQWPRRVERSWASTSCKGTLLAHATRTPAFLVRARPGRDQRGHMDPTLAECCAPTSRSRILDVSREVGCSSPAGLSGFV